MKKENEGLMRFMERIISNKEDAARVDVAAKDKLSRRFFRIAVPAIFLGAAVAIGSSYAINTNAKNIENSAQISHPDRIPTINAYVNKTPDTMLDLREFYNLDWNTEDLRNAQAIYGVPVDVVMAGACEYMLGGDSNNLTAQQVAADLTQTAKRLKSEGNELGLRDFMMALALHCDGGVKTIDTFTHAPQSHKALGATAPSSQVAQAFQDKVDLLVEAERNRTQEPSEYSIDQAAEIMMRHGKQTEMMFNILTDYKNDVNTQIDSEYAKEFSQEGHVEIINAAFNLTKNLNQEAGQNEGDDSYSGNKVPVKEGADNTKEEEKESESPSIFTSLKDFAMEAIRSRNEHHATGRRAVRGLFDSDN